MKQYHLVYNSKNQYLYKKISYYFFKDDEDSDSGDDEIENENYKKKKSKSKNNKKKTNNKEKLFNIYPLSCKVTINISGKSNQIILTKGYSLKKMFNKKKYEISVSL